MGIAMGIRAYGGRIARTIGDAEKRLEAALGYLQLGMFEEANEEIEQLPLEDKVSPGVLRLRTAIYSETKSWHLLREGAGFLVDSLPGDPQHWIWLAYATRRTASIPAETILLQALESHPSGRDDSFQPRMLRRPDREDRGGKGKAPEARLLALDDPDLEPLLKVPEGGESRRRKTSSERVLGTSPLHGRTVGMVSAAKSHASEFRELGETSGVRDTSLSPGEPSFFTLVRTLGRHIFGTV